MSNLLDTLGRRFARVATNAVVVRPALWPVFRGPLRKQFDHLASTWEGRLGPEGLAPLEPSINGDPSRSVPYILNVAFPGLDAETVIEAWSGLVAISNGAACSSQRYTCSHVLEAMSVPAWQRDGALRFSWCAASVAPDWRDLVSALEPYRDMRKVGSV